MTRRIDDASLPPSHSLPFNLSLNLPFKLSVPVVIPAVQPVVEPVVSLSLYLPSNGRARRGTGGTLNRQSAIAGLNSLLEVYGCGV